MKAHEKAVETAPRKVVDSEHPKGHATAGHWDEPPAVAMVGN